MTHPRITFIGAGNMATSLIGGLLAQGIPASHIRASVTRFFCPADSCRAGASS